MRKEAAKGSFLSFDLASKLVISFLSIFYIQNVKNEANSVEVTFAR